MLSQCSMIGERVESQGREKVEGKGPGGGAAWEVMGTLQLVSGHASSTDCIQGFRLQTLSHIDVHFSLTN